MSSDADVLNQQTGYKMPPTPLAMKRVIWDLISESVRAYNATLAPAYTKTPADGPVVTIRLAGRTPGGKTGEVYKPRLRAYTVSSDGSQVVEYYAQGVRCTYSIEVYSNHELECDELTDTIEETLRVAVPDMQMRYGIDEFFLSSQESTMMVEHRGEQVYRNTLTYSAVMERVYRMAKPAITLIEVGAATGTKLYKDVPVRHTGQAYRLVETGGREYRDVVQVLFGADVQGIYDKVVLDRLDEVPLEYGVYVPGVDFVPYPDEQQRCILLWTEHGRTPAIGSVFYLTFRSLDERVSLS